MKVAPVNRAAELAAIQKINELHALAERQQTVCSDSIYAALRAAWEAGSLLVDQKGRIARGNWALWLELNFKGNIRTAQRYMALAKACPEIAVLRGLTLRQAYLRLGIAVAKAPGEKPTTLRRLLPPHAALANRFQRWMRQRLDVRALPEHERRTLQRDLRPVRDWLNRLFDEGGATNV